MKGPVVANKEYGTYGYIDFTKLWDLLEKRGLNKRWLIINGIYSNTVAKMVKNQNITCEIIAKICFLLDCQPSDILEYKKS